MKRPFIENVLLKQTVNTSATYLINNFVKETTQHTYNINLKWKIKKNLHR